MTVSTPNTRVLLIGASRGLGLALAAEYLDRGAHVVATARDADPTALTELTQRFGDRLEIERVDITDPDGVSDLDHRLDGRSFDLLFVNAGTTNRREETPVTVATEEFARVMTTNALSPLRTIEILGHLVPSDGMIGIMSSGQGSVANNTRGDFEIYRASKAALNQLMRSYAARHREDSRTLLLMAPGWVQTDLGGPEARLTVEESIPRLVDVVDAQRGTPHLQYLDYQGQTVPW